MTNVIETNGLTKRYGGTLCVRDLDLAVPEGAIYGFLGPNGAGKTTSLKMILGLVRPTAGETRVFGRIVNGRNRLGILRQVGSLIESPGYYGHLTGEENLRIVQTLRDVPAGNIGEMLRLVRLDGQEGKLVRQYSLGMKQRLGLACAMLGHPRLLILDEPTNGLDPAGIQEMRELIISLPARYEMTVLVSSHLLSEIDQIATSVGIIDRGELVFQNTLAALHAQSEQHLAVRTLDNAAAADILRRQGLAPTVWGDDLLLPDMADEDVARSSLALAAGGLGAVRIVEQRKSLEDVFLELTGTVVSL
jgi:ABC-2 type transport system ATP-binding protein